MILPAWFDHLEERLSYKEAQFYPPEKSSYSPAQIVNKTPARGAEDTTRRREEGQGCYFSHEQDILR